ncbi:MAG: DnaD domain protein [Chloroflexi bacterium]|nr:DnaD domain protein [Chloroflexota bacterium]
MNNQPFRGFPPRLSFTPIPNLFFARLLPEMDSLAEVKLVLHIFWRLYQKRGALKFVTYKELVADKTLRVGRDEAGDLDGALRSALESAVERGVLLHLVLERDGGWEEVYFVNTEANRQAVAKIQNGELSLGALPQPQPHIEEEKPNIFALYEQNIGLLTPMIAEELKEAERLYPASWIEEAFKEAVSLNKRSWRYIARILERWATEGKGSGESGRDPKKKRDPSRYFQGKYGHLVKR